ncbi:MAG: carboxypeptidase regulatory-like domain-containing protein [Caldilineaceae bacterium]
MAPIYGYEQWNYLNTTVTDDSGNYTFTELEGGIYRIQFQDDNIPPAYGTIYYNQIATAATATDVNLGENETIGAIDAQLPLRGALGGRVTDSQGTPLAGIAVHMDKEWSFYDGTIYWNTAAFTTTTASGFYRLNALEPGNYRLTFQDSDGVPNHIGEIYDDADSYETATTVVVSAGQLITGINAALDETGAITGVVTIDSGQPLANATVSLYRRIEDQAFRFGKLSNPPTPMNGAAINFSGSFPAPTGSTLSMAITRPSTATNITRMLRRWRVLPISKSAAGLPLPGSMCSWNNLAKLRAG